jgi:hypothetical protein
LVGGAIGFNVGFLGGLVVGITETIIDDLLLSGGVEAGKAKPGNRRIKGIGGVAQALFRKLLNVCLSPELSTGIIAFVASVGNPAVAIIAATGAHVEKNVLEHLEGKGRRKR